MSRVREFSSPTRRHETGSLRIFSTASEALGENGEQVLANDLTKSPVGGFLGCCLPPAAIRGRKGLA